MQENKRNTNSFFENLESVASEPTERKQPPVSKATEQPAKSPPTDPNTENPFFIPDKEKTDSKTSQKISEDQIKSNGITGAFLVEAIHEVLFSTIERFVFISKFSAEEKERIMEISGSDENGMSEADKSLNRRFLFLTQKHEKIREKIPVTEREREVLEKAFAEYSRATGKNMNPSLILVATGVKLICNRAIDIFL